MSWIGVIVGASAKVMHASVIRICVRILAIIAICKLLIVSRQRAVIELFGQLEKQYLSIILSISHLEYTIVDASLCSQLSNGVRGFYLGKNGGGASGSVSVDVQPIVIRG